MAELRIERDLKKSQRPIAGDPIHRDDGLVEVPYRLSGSRVAWARYTNAEWAEMVAAESPDPTPTPDPTPVPVTVESSRLYAADSLFNTPIAADALTHPQSPQWVAMLLKNGGPSDMLAGVAGSALYDWGKPNYYSKTTDPMVKLHATSAWGTCSIEGMVIPVPASALPAGADDGHMTIFTPDGWEFGLWRAQKPANGVLNFEWCHGRLRVDGPGFPGGGVAARMASGAGPIRAHELIAGKIEHALFSAINCASSAYVSPASASDGSTAGGIPQGSRIQLAMSDAQIQALAVPAWQRTILTALAHYGTIVGDSTGNPRMTIQFESEQGYVSQGKPAPLAEFAKRPDVGIPLVNGAYAFKVSQGVDWAKYLRVIQPPAH